MLRVLTREIEPGGLMMVEGHGIDGGLLGAPRVYLTLYRGDTSPAVGVCGEKACQASNAGSQTIGCNSRLGSSENDGASGMPQLASSWTNATSFGCTVEDRAGLQQATGYYKVAVAHVGRPAVPFPSITTLITNRVSTRGHTPSSDHLIRTSRDLA